MILPRVSLLFAVAVTASLTGPPKVGLALEFHVVRDSTRSVTFISDAPIEDFEGVTTAIDGYIIWDGSDFTPPGGPEGSEFHFEVRLDELDTGINLRNRHMREQYLHTDQFPYAEYTGALDSATAMSDTSWTVFTRGILAIHGVEQERTIACTVTRAGRGYRVETAFPVRLGDHDIDIPSLMFLKINEVIELELAFSLAPAEVQ